MMVKINTQRYPEYVHHGSIVRITVAGTASQWHGIRSIVRTHDGGVIESTDSAETLLRAIEAAKEES